MNRSESLTQSILDLINNPEDKIKQQPRPPYREVQSMEAEEDIVQKTLEEMNRISDSIPTFHYPFKRRSNTATKTKSDQEIFEEILFKDKTAQYLFNSSGLFHGGVHLKAEEFEMDFEVESIRAIADGELVYYRIDKKYLKNRLEDSHNEFDVLYSTGFFLLEHKMEYPKGNRLKFYSLYMHTAPSYDYEFEEYVVMGASAYARKTSDNSKADDFVKFGDRVVLGKPIPNKDGRYELLTVNGIKMPSGFNVHISNLQYEAVITSVTGSNPNMRKGNTSKSPSEGLLKDKSSITVHPYQTEEQKKNKRYKVLKAIKADGTEAVVGSKSTIHATNIKAKIPEVHIYTKNNNGIVQPHMKEMAGTNLKAASKDFKVKAGEELGKLGVYNSEWYETELDKVIHLEVFTFDDLKTFIEKAKEEYKKPIEDLSDEEKKLRPKENQLFIKKDVTRYIKESYTYAKLTEADWLRDKTVKNTKTDKTLNVLKVNKKPQKIKKDSILKINPTKDGRRYKIISVEEGDSEVQSVISSDTSEKWSVYEKSIEIFHGFNEIPKEVKQYYVNVCKPLKTLKKLKDKEGTEYIQIDKIANIEIYVKDDEKYKTHGITFSNFTLIDEAGADEIGIFEEVSKYYEKNTKEEKTPQEDKEKLNDTFKAILQNIKIDKNKNGRLEAGEFASLSLTKEKRKELSYMMVKHTSEWEYEKEKFQPILDYLDQDPKQEKNKKMFEDRLEKLAFFPKDIVGEGRIPTFIHPIALVEGFVGSPCYCGRDFTVEEVKNIVKELRDSEKALKGKYSLFGKSNCKIPEADKTYERFTEELNLMMQKYKINTCLRKMHFLTQAYHETDRFRTAREGGGNTYLTSKSYYPYIGRGMMQLTWKVSYEQYKYYSSLDCITTPNIIENDLHNVIDSAGWYWQQGKVLSSSRAGTWKAPTFAGTVGTAVGLEKPSCEKKIVSNNHATKKYGVINFNSLADNDWINTISWLVNGGGNGFSERQNYLIKIKEIFNYEEQCINKKKTN